ncbi:MAG: CRISPR-associated endonuclease Cas3'', partial [Planctomycetaceae bacterium]|nr:CRISPR-associated endonuclease Cas3'' [Planctomycetaceae bacterium]
MTYLAHKDQPLDDHLNTVAQLAGQFAEKFGSQDWAKAAGRLHDLGKLLDGFQHKLHAAYGLEYEHEDDNASGLSKHSGVGAVFAEEKYGKSFGRTLAYLIAGHHTGLPDYQTEKTGQKALSFRLQEAKKELDEVRHYKDNRLQLFTDHLPPLKL